MQNVGEKLRENVSGLTGDLEKQNNWLAVSEETYSKYNTAISNQTTLLNDVTNKNFSGIKDSLDNLYTNFSTHETATTGVLKEQAQKCWEEYTSMKKACEDGNTFISLTDVTEAGKRAQRAQFEYDKSAKNAEKGAQEQGTAYQNGLESKEADINATSARISENSNKSLGSSDTYSTGAQQGNDFVSGITDAISGSADLISQLMTSVIGRATVSVDSSQSTSNRTKCATGGIVTRSTIAEIGEDGAEAIIPLEKNTEWIDNVAKRISGGTSNNAVVEKLNELIEIMKDRKVYLDSGALVGEIAPAMDGALGTISKMKRRGL